ncbi:PIR protein [Plasmodium vivax]|nr:PIR protein [Plasmodium vivax]
MNWKSGRSNHFLEYLKKIKNRECTDKYFVALNEIGQKIDKIDKALKIPSKNSYKLWENVNNFIKEKNGELKECYERQYISLHLNKEDKIINFSKICTNDGKCNTGNTQVKKPTATKTEIKGTCKGERNCEKQAPTARAEQITPKTKPLLSDTITVSSPRSDPKIQGQKATAGQESRNANVSTQPQRSITNLAPPVVAEVEVSEHKVHQDSMISEQDKAQKEQLAVSESSKVNLEDTPPRAPFVPTATNDVSATGHSSGVIDPGKNTIQSKLPCNETFDGNLSCQHHISDQDLARNEGNDKALSSNIRDNTFMTSGVSLDENPSDKDHVGASPKVADLVSATSSEQPGEERGTEMVSGDVSTINSEGSDIKNYSDEKSSNADTDTQDSPNKILCAEGSSDKMLSSDAPCNAEIDSGLVADNGNKSDIFEKFLEAISNKDHIIQTSAPMGIVMLLGLLFKFTPLWRVLTKKNRKKGAGIIEELNSVVQEPSIMDEERSIPFSYSAFEYSS